MIRTSGALNENSLFLRLGDKLFCGIYCVQFKDFAIEGDMLAWHSRSLFASTCVWRGSLRQNSFIFRGWKVDSLDQVRAECAQQGRLLELAPLTAWYLNQRIDNEKCVLRL